MHILEQYALNCGVKIGKPFIVDKFYPLPCEKYITFNPFGKFESRNYDYWQYVVDTLYPILSPLGIQIVQIGGKNERPYQKCINLSGQTNLNQTAYVVKNSLLHFGVDSFPIHLASVFNRKIVALYCNMYSQQSKPYWSDDNDIRLIQAPLNGTKPSYSANEPVKTINSIKPEIICKNILELLGINTDNLPETIYIGSRYSEQMIECIPNTIIHPESFKDSLLNIRCDYVDNLDLNILYGNLSIRPCAIVTDKSFDTAPLKDLKQNLHMLIYDITSGIDQSFIDSISSIGIRYTCVVNSQKISAEQISQYKLELMDYCAIEEYKLIPENAPQKIDSNILCKTNRVLLSNGKVFAGRSFELENIEIKDINNLVTDISLLKNINLFLEELDHYLLFKKSI